MSWWKKLFGEQPGVSEKPASFPTIKPKALENQAVKSTAVQALDPWKDVDTVVRIALHDPDPSTRSAAKAKLLPHHVKDSPELLVGFFPFNGYDAGIAAKWLVEKHAEWLRLNLSSITDEVLLTSLASACGNEVEIGLAALDRCKAPPPQNLIDVVANSFRLVVRSRALELLKSTTYPYFEVLVQFLEKPEGTVTFKHVSECLAHAHEPRVFGPLVDILAPWLEGKPHYEPIILWAAAEALGHLGDTRAVDVLVQVLQSDEEPMGSAKRDEHTDCVRKAAAEALAIIGDKRAIPALRRALQIYTACFDPFAPGSISSSERFVSSAGLAVAEALGTLGDRESVQYVRELRDCKGATICGNIKERIDRILHHIESSS